MSENSLIGLSEINIYIYLNKDISIGIIF